MKALYGRIQQLEQKLLQLLADHEQQKSTIQKLQQENEQLRQTMAMKDKALQRSSKQLGIDAISKQLGGTQGAEISKMLSNYIKDIDQCIAFFERCK